MENIKDDDEPGFGEDMIIDPNISESGASEAESDRSADALETPIAIAPPSPLPTRPASRALPTPPSAPNNNSPPISSHFSSNSLGQDDSLGNAASQRSFSFSPAPAPVPSPVPSVTVDMSSVQSPTSRVPLEERLKRAVSPRSGSSAMPAPISYSPAARTPSPNHQERQNLLVIAHSHDAEGRPLESTPLSATFDFSHPGVDVAEMRSALDRLVDEVSINTEGAGEDEGQSKMMHTSCLLERSVDRSFATSEGDVSMAETEVITVESTELLASLSMPGRNGPPPMERTTSAPAAPLYPSTFTPSSVPASRVPSTSALPPIPAPKDGKSARQLREEMIKEKRREQRARDSGEYFIPPRRDIAGKLMDESPASRRQSGGRPSARRSLSTGDAQDLLSEVSLSRSAFVVRFYSNVFPDRGCSTADIYFEDAARRCTGERGSGGEQCAVEREH